MTSIFLDSDLAIESFMFTHSLLISKEFIQCADIQLTDQFIFKTGLRPSKNLNISISGHNVEDNIYGTYLKPDGVTVARRLMLKLYVNHSWNNITICWKSKNDNRDYKIHDKIIDCNDIEFWFDKLDPHLYYSQLYPNDILPFKLKNLSYTLEIHRLNINCTFKLFLKAIELDKVNYLKDEIYKFVERFNIESERKSRKDGVVHNINIKQSYSQKINIDLDLGSTGIVFLKDFLLFLSGMKIIEKIVIQ